LDEKQKKYGSTPDKNRIPHKQAEKPVSHFRKYRNGIHGYRNGLTSTAASLTLRPQVHENVGPPCMHCVKVLNYTFNLFSSTVKILVMLGAVARHSNLLFNLFSSTTRFVLVAPASWPKLNYN